MTSDGSVPGARLVETVDPVAEVVRGALAYVDAPRDLSDDQPLPGLRVGRDVRASGCVLRLRQLRGDEVVDDVACRVDLVPLDRAAARPRRRVHPAPTRVLELVTTADPDQDRLLLHRAGAGAADGAESAGGAEPEETSVTTAVLPRHGPVPVVLEELAAAAAEHRLVRVDDPLAGDPVLTAALLLRIVASGTPCLATDRAVESLDLLHPELRDALRGADRAAVRDDLALASVAATQRRIAWTHHDLRLAWGAPGHHLGVDEVRDRSPGVRDGAADATRDGADDAWRPRLVRPTWPAVSVVLVTRRPELLPAALAMLASQRDVELEVVVALHGKGDPGSIRGDLGLLGLEGDVIGVPASVPFGAVLDAAIARTSAPMVLKWDDDDLYGPHHVADLLVAHRQTGAGLVGKAPEFVYLEASDTTVWRTPGRAEAPSLGLAGGTFLTPRALLEDLGGYPPVGRAIDHYLKTAVKERGLTVFRTHGFGFVLRRHDRGHTWEADDERFLREAVATMDGLPEVLGLGNASRFGQLGSLHCCPC